MDVIHFLRSSYCMCTDLQSVSSKINHAHMHGNLRNTAYKLVRPGFSSHAREEFLLNVSSQQGCFQGLLCTQAVSWQVEVL